MANCIFVATYDLLSLCLMCVLRSEPPVKRLAAHL